MNPYDTRCEVCGEQAWGSARCLRHRTEEDRDRMGRATVAFKGLARAALVRHHGEGAHIDAMMRASGL